MFQLNLKERLQKHYVNTDTFINVNTDIFINVNTVTFITLTRFRRFVLLIALSYSPRNVIKESVDVQDLYGIATDILTLQFYT
jgi:hypothetical protein